MARRGEEEEASAGPSGWKKPVQVNAVDKVEEAIEQPKQDVQAEQAVFAVPVEPVEAAALETFEISSETVLAEQPSINVEAIEVGT